MNSYAQLKDTIFLNEDFIKLTKETYFSNEKNEHFFHFQIQEDSTTIALIKVAKRKHGRIDINTHNKIKKYLFYLSDEKIDSTKTIIINYFPKQDNCYIANNPWSKASIKNFKRFVQELKNKENISQFFIFKDTRTVNNFNDYFTNENQLKGAIYGINDYIPQHNDLGNIKINDDLCEVVYSSLLYLNDSKGGELVLNGIDFTISKGDITVFPAETIHKVKPVLSGERYAVMFRLYRKL